MMLRVAAATLTYLSTFHLLASPLNLILPHTFYPSYLSVLFSTFFPYVMASNAVLFSEAAAAAVHVSDLVGCVRAVGSTETVGRTATLYLDTC